MSFLLLLTLNPWGAELRSFFGKGGLTEQIPKAELAAY